MASTISVDVAIARVRAGMTVLPTGMTSDDITLDLSDAKAKFPRVFFGVRERDSTNASSGPVMQKFEIHLTALWVDSTHQNTMISLVSNWVNYLMGNGNTHWPAGVLFQYARKITTPENALKIDPNLYKAEEIKRYNFSGEIVVSLDSDVVGSIVDKEPAYGSLPTPT